MDDGSCAVCAETLEWVAYGPCGHRDVCALCIARLRFVCDDRPDAKDGKVGSYWYHEDTQAYFDDLDEYKIIKAMCKLSCSVCDKLGVEGKRNSRRKGKIKSVEQLKDHLSHQHELFFCSLCLEYKKVFISEQKLYSRVQLRQHISYGDSDVDGSENERCGFSGHPFCEFCQRPFYGDNELYFHMSTEHYTCHICERLRSTESTPFEYYKDYNDLENHFREAHFLCEDDTCLEKKFVVFSTIADMKHHSALEHGGSMSRSKRQNALQLRACFHHRERDEGLHVRAHASLPGTSNVRLSSANSANGERTNTNLLYDATSAVQAIPIHRETSDIGSAATTVPSSGHRQGAALDFRSVLLNGSELPRSTKRRRHKSRKKSEEIGINHSPAISSSQLRLSDAEHLSQSSPIISHQIGALAVGHSPSSNSISSYSLLSSMSSDIASASSANSLTISVEDVAPSSSAPNVINKASNEGTVIGDDIKAANKSLVEKICASLEYDKDKYAAFKIISKEYREGEIGAGEYFAYVHQFGLAHLIVDLARLCPDPQKQKELMKIHMTSLGNSIENRPRKESCKTTASKLSNKGKEKCGDSGGGIKGESLLDSIANNFKDLKLDAKPREEDFPSLKVVERLFERNSKTSIIEDVGHVSGGGSNNSPGEATAGGKKKMKKKSKFLKARLGESSASAVPDSSCSDLASDLMVVRPDQDSILASVRGVWRNDGGRRLMKLSQAVPTNR
uniref:C2H2-type domain-containing protein n=1 Tax=Chenopodium quinoa TaxID=63459 RepID=A0A803KN55_CHEQI